MLKATVMAGALCLAMVTGAHAKCGTNQLNGNWYVLVGDDGVETATILNGSLVILGNNFPISQSPGCKVTLTFMGEPFTGSSESISKSSSLKPRQIDVASTTVNFSFSLVRR